MSDIIPTKRHRRQFTILQRLQILDELNGLNATAKSVAAKHNLSTKQIVEWEKDTKLYLALVKEGKGHMTKSKPNKDPSIPAGVNAMTNGRFVSTFTCWSVPISFELPSLLPPFPDLF